MDCCSGSVTHFRLTNPYVLLGQKILAKYYHRHMHYLLQLIVYAKLHCHHLFNVSSIVDNFSILINKQNSVHVEKSHMADRPHDEHHSGGLRKATNRQLWRWCTCPITHIHDFPSSMKGKRISSILDLVQTHYQIELAPDDLRKTAVTKTLGG